MISTKITHTKKQVLDWKYIIIVKEQLAKNRKCYPLQVKIDPTAI